MAIYEWWLVQVTLEQPILNFTQNMVQDKHLSSQTHLLELHRGSFLQPHLIFPKCSLGQALSFQVKELNSDMFFVFLPTDVFLV